MQSIIQDKNLNTKYITNNNNNDVINKNHIIKRNTGKEVENRFKIKKDRGDSDPVGNSKEKTNKKIDNLNRFGVTIHKDRDEIIPNDRSKVYQDVPEPHDKNKPDRKPDKYKSSAKQRVLLIKTITDSEDITKTYKAVTFTDEKPQKTLNIKIPNVTDVKKTKIPKPVDRVPKYQKNIEPKPVEIKKNKKSDKFKHQREPSPIIVCKQDGEPPTEVAKWAPFSVSKETKPYYEAWVNTTLTARTRKDTLLDEPDIIKNYKSSIDRRSYSPELFYENLYDERFTGKIRINHG